MIIIGLAGGSGAGKGEVCRAFLSLNIEAVDTDKVSRSVTGKGSECLRELTENFTGAILTPYGELDRKKLAEIAFSSKENLLLLNSITHKHILNECAEWLSGRQRAGREAVIIDAPLLFEGGLNKSCDIVISVIADRELRLNRIIKRDGISLEAAEKRINSQKSDEFLKQNSDYIIENNGSYAQLLVEVTRVYEKIKQKYPKP